MKILPLLPLISCLLLVLLLSGSSLGQIGTAHYNITLVGPHQGDVFFRGQEISISFHALFANASMLHDSIVFIDLVQEGYVYPCTDIFINEGMISCVWNPPNPPYGFFDIVITVNDLQGNVLQEEDYEHWVRIASLPRLSDVFVSPPQGPSSGHFTFSFILLDDDGEENNVSLWIKPAEATEWSMKASRIMKGPVSQGNFTASFNPGTYLFRIRTKDSVGFFESPVNDFSVLPPPQPPEVNWRQLFQKKNSVIAGENNIVGVYWFGNLPEARVELQVNRSGEFVPVAERTVFGNGTWTNFTIETESEGEIFWRISFMSTSWNIAKTTETRHFLVVPNVTVTPPNTTANNTNVSTNQTPPAGNNQTDFCGDLVCQAGEYGSCCTDCGCPEGKECADNVCINVPPPVSGNVTQNRTQQITVNESGSNETGEKRIMTGEVNAEPNETVRIEIDEEEIGFNEISIRTRERVRNASLQIRQVKDFVQSPGTEVTGHVYQYIEVTPEAITDEDIETVNVGFRVEKQWIKDNSISPLLVKLFRLEDSWKEMSTTFIGESDIYAYYEAEVPGFSLFAIAGSILEQTNSTCVPYDRMCNGRNLLECNLYGERWELVKVCDNFCVDDECRETEGPTEEQSSFMYAITLVAIIIILFVMVSIFVLRHKRTVDNLTSYGSYR